MISKKISDLKDINFEISTALQFEPSPMINSSHRLLNVETNIIVNSSSLVLNECT